MVIFLDLHKSFYAIFNFEILFGDFSRLVTRHSVDYQCLVWQDARIYSTVYRLLRLSEIKTLLVANNAL